MTNERAINVIKDIKNYYNDKSEYYEDGYIGFDKEDNEAIDLAIKALEQGYVLDRMKAEINEWYWQADKQALAKDPCVVDAMVDLFIRTIDKYKAESEDKE